MASPFFVVWASSLSKFREIIFYPDYNHKVEWMELYINGYKVRREMNAPYEWGRPNSGGDHYLRNMKRGTYTLKCKIKTKCGGIEWKEKRITVH